MSNIVERSTQAPINFLYNDVIRTYKIPCELQYPCKQFSDRSAAGHFLALFSTTKIMAV